MPTRPPVYRNPHAPKPPPRPSSVARGYGGEWKERRLRILRRDKWTCQACKRDDLWKKKVDGGPGAHVDHIIDKALGGTDDDHNLRTLCHPCHSRRTAKESGGYGHERRGVTD